MKKLIFSLGIIGGSLLLAFSILQAQHTHGISKGGATKMETREVLVEGVKITFYLMTNEEHKKMLREMKMKEEIEPGTTHNISLTLKEEKSQNDLPPGQVQMKVVGPRGKEQIKALKYEETMKSYDAYFNLGEKGEYQILVLVKIGDLKRTAGITYKVK